jgi:hypothetical protein
MQVYLLHLGVPSSPRLARGVGMVLVAGSVVRLAYFVNGGLNAQYDPGECLELSLACAVCLQVKLGH